MKKGTVLGLNQLNIQLEQVYQNHRLTFDIKFKQVQL
jgi:hypothetical protein